MHDKPPLITERQEMIVILVCLFPGPRYLAEHVPVGPFPCPVCDRVRHNSGSARPLDLVIPIESMAYALEYA